MYRESESLLLQTTLFMLSVSVIICMDVNYCEISPAHTLCQYAVSVNYTRLHTFLINFYLYEICRKSYL